MLVDPQTTLSSTAFRHFHQRTLKWQHPQCTWIEQMSAMELPLDKTELFSSWSRFSSVASFCSITFHVACAAICGQMVYCTILSIVSSYPHRIWPGSVHMFILKHIPADWGMCSPLWQEWGSLTDRPTRTTWSRAVENQSERPIAHRNDELTVVVISWARGENETWNVHTGGFTSTG